MWVADWVTVRSFRSQFRMGTLGCIANNSNTKAAIAEFSLEGLGANSKQLVVRGGGSLLLGLNYRWRSILFPLLWLKLYDDTEGILVELIAEMNVKMLPSFHLVFLLEQSMGKFLFYELC